MCWRDDIVTSRVCSACGQTYYGDLGHRGCPGHVPSAKEILRKERIEAVGTRHGWDRPTTLDKIKRTEEILCINDESAIDFLLEAIPNTKRDVIDKLEDDNPPF